MWSKSKNAKNSVLKNANKNAENPSEIKDFWHFCYGRSGGTRTHGLQYPKLARYHLRYASISKKTIDFFVVVSYVVNPEF